MRWISSKTSRIVTHPHTIITYSRALHNDAHLVNYDRSFFEKLYLQFGFTNSECWYNVTTKDIIKHGGDEILMKYDNSMIKVLTAVFPGIVKLDNCPVQH